MDDEVELCKNCGHIIVSMTDCRGLWRHISTGELRCHPQGFRRFVLWLLPGLRTYAEVRTL